MPAPKDDSTGQSRTQAAARAVKSVPDHQEELTERLARVTTVYTDLDNTLVGPGGSLFLTAEKEYTVKPAEALIEAAISGLDVVVVSGRGRRQLFGDTRLMGLKNFIAELGGLLVYGGGREVFYNVGSYKREGETVYETIRKSGACEFLFSALDSLLEYHTPWSEGREITHVLRGFVDCDEAGRLLAGAGFGELKLVDNGVIHTRGRLTHLDEVHAYHVTPMATDKASGVRKDREIRAIPRAACVAVGDSISDLVLAPEVEAMFVVRNGLDNDSLMLEAVAAYDNVFVTAGSTGVGFAEVIGLLKR